MHFCELHYYTVLSDKLVYSPTNTLALGFASRMKKIQTCKRSLVQIRYILCQLVTLNKANVWCIFVVRPPQVMKISLKIQT